MSHRDVRKRRPRGSAEEGIRRQTLQQTVFLQQTSSTCQTSSSTEKKHSTRPLSPGSFHPAVRQRLTPEEPELTQNAAVVWTPANHKLWRNTLQEGRVILYYFLFKMSASKWRSVRWAEQDFLLISDFMEQLQYCEVEMNFTVCEHYGRHCGTCPQERDTNTPLGGKAPQFPYWDYVNYNCWKLKSVDQSLIFSYMFTLLTSTLDFILISFEDQIKLLNSQ